VNRLIPFAMIAKADDWFAQRESAKQEFWQRYHQDRPSNMTSIFIKFGTSVLAVVVVGGLVSWIDSNPWGNGSASGAWFEGHDCVCYW
jgi:hypothetical protein